MAEHERQIISEKEIFEMEAFNALPKIGFVGPPSSGKGTAGEIVASQFHMATATFSGGIHDHLEFVHGVPPPHPRDLLKQTGIYMIKSFGELANFHTSMKTVMYKYAQDQTTRGVILDGFRWLEETKAFVRLPNSLLVWVQADQELRKERLFERNRSGDLNQTNYYETDNMEQEWIAPLKQLAHYRIMNNGTRAEFESQVINLVSSHFSLKTID